MTVSQCPSCESIKQLGEYQVTKVNEFGEQIIERVKACDLCEPLVDNKEILEVEKL